MSDPALNNVIPAIAAALKKLSDDITCLVEGPPEKVVLAEPPKDPRRVSAWQEFAKPALGQDVPEGTLHLKLEGPDTTWCVEVVYEGAEDVLAMKPSVRLTSTGTIEHFDLPEAWRCEKAPRFLTVYLRPHSATGKKDPKAGGKDEDATAPAKKTQEDKATLIRIIPASLTPGDTRYYDDIEGIAETDD
jgi:hypothetical protein